jgi:cyclopropane fatty-acyl-phospholipid synthase-like methyltransferase
MSSEVVMVHFFNDISHREIKEYMEKIRGLVSSSSRMSLHSLPITNSISSSVFVQYTHSIINSI